MSRTSDSEGEAQAPRSARVVARLVELLPAVVVIVVAAALTWPVPAGRMPMSADHTVHLTRVVLTAERLMDQGALSGWEPTWFFGFPLGDLYPQLGDLLIIAIRGLSLGLLDWPQAYALGFFVVFVIQGLVLLRIGRLFGYGPWPGLIAALLMLTDPGFTREGGWMYTVYFGVWPQALATSLAWLSLGELARALGWRPSSRLVDGDAREAVAPEAGLRAAGIAALCMGAALLAHPIAAPTLAIGGGLLVLTLVPRAPLEWRRALARCLLVALLAAAIAAWWWLPMLQHRAWMASYGWLFSPLDTMLSWLVEEGRWAQRMPAAVGFLALVGVALASLGAGRVARFVAVFALVQWLLASSDAFWQLRLDHFSEGFTHIQYQRFLIGAKPGLFLCAGLAVIAPASWARALWLRESKTRRAPVLVAAFVLAGLSAGAGAWLLADSRETLSELAARDAERLGRVGLAVGEVQTERLPGDPDFDAHYQEFTAWAAQQWAERDGDYRIAVRSARNEHLFMDAPVWTDTWQYKLGFTPGDNFVHKPESGRRELLDALSVRWMVGRDRGAPRIHRDELARFGPIHVRAHAGEARGPAWLEGPGELELLEADLRGGRVRARVTGTGEGSRVVFAIAGYPRWRLFLDGEPLEWVEVPVWGNGPLATQADRRGGRLRGGKADGDDGSEPTLIAAELPANLGDTGAELELRYAQHEGPGEWIAEFLSLLALLVVGLSLPRRELRGWPARLRGAALAVEARLAQAAHPLVLALLVVVALSLAGLRWRDSAAREADDLVGWVEAGAVASERAEAGPVKTAMLIRPAVILRPRPGRPARVELRVDALGEELRGWYGLDDDQAKQRGRWARHELHIEARPLDGGPGEWTTIARMSVRHAPEQVHFALPTGELAGRSVMVRITDETEGQRLPRLGLDLELGGPP